MINYFTIALWRGRRNDFVKRILHTGKIADIGDYLKLTACTAVMLQPILNLALRTMPEATTQMVIGAVYNLVKFTAPAFIFGILYTTMRTTVDTAVTYQQYLKQSWHSLFVPTLWWTSIYLLAMPGSNRSDTTIAGKVLSGSLLTVTLPHICGITRWCCSLYCLCHFFLADWPMVSDGAKAWLVHCGANPYYYRTLAGILWSWSLSWPPHGRLVFNWQVIYQFLDLRYFGHACLAVSQGC